MAGSPKQEQLVGITYPDQQDIDFEKIDLNDLDVWEPYMEAKFNQGADFIQVASEKFLSERERLNRLKKKHPNSSNNLGKPPSIFVHCVAGVNRSAFVVVWWLVKYHSMSMEQAWELVTTRRDQGANWNGVCLGGMYPPAGYQPPSDIQPPVQEQDHNVNDDSYKYIVVPKIGESIATHSYPKFHWYTNGKRCLAKFLEETSKKGAINPSTKPVVSSVNVVARKRSDSVTSSSMGGFLSKLTG